VAIAGILAIDVLYLAIVRLQGDPPPVDVLTVPFIAGYLLLMAALLGASLIALPALRPALRAAASCGLLVLGLLAAFSIGILILATAALAITSLAQSIERDRSPRTLGASLAASVVAVAVLVAGLQLAWNFLVCPSTGQVSGTAGFFGQSHYQCTDGRLTESG
jgi:hypothetical protein